VLNAAGVVVASDLQSECFPLLVDSTHAVVCDMVEAEAAVVSVDLRSNTRTTLGRAEGHFWDDVPLALTPDGQHVIFYLRAERRGLMSVPLAGGVVRPLPEHATLVAFSTRGDEAFILLHEIGGERLLRRFAFRAGVFSDPRPMVDGGLLGWSVDDDRALVLARRDDTFELQQLTLSSGALHMIDPHAHIGDGTGHGAFARVSRDEVLYLGQTEAGAVLRVADLSGAAAPRDLPVDPFTEGIIVGVVP